MNWYTIHVYYYATNKDALILHAVRPLFRLLAGRVAAASFTRHWRQGPHLRLNVRTDPRTFRSVVQPAAREIIGDFLARRPSTRPLVPAWELAAHRRLAELEQETGPLMPWFPDNSIRVAAFDSREGVLGGRATADLYAGFYADTTELAFDMIERVSGPQRLATAYNLMIATAHALSGTDISRAFVSFRSHAEGFLCGFPEGADARAGWDAHYRRNADALVARLDAVLATVDGGRNVVPFVREWTSTLSAYRDRAATLVDGGLISMPAAAVAWDDVAQPSPFHRRLFANPRWQQTLVSAEFVLYRLMLNFTYLSLTRLGVTPPERFLLCHLAANAVEERYGVSAYDLIGPAAVGRDAGPR